MKVVVLFDLFGPYHWARLNAASIRGRIFGIEIFGSNVQYPWGRVTDKSGFVHQTLFPHGNRQNVSPLAVRRKLQSSLQVILPDVVFLPGWSDYWSLAALDWCVKQQVPTVMMSESTAGDERRQTWKEFIKSRVVGLCSAALVGGTPHRSYVQTLGMTAGRTFTGYNAVDNAYFKERTSALRAQTATVRTKLDLPPRFFLGSNRLIEKKNLAALIAGYAAYSRQTGEQAWSLVLLGDGPLRESIERQLAELDLQAKVYLPGFKQYEELPMYYALASGFVHASTTEQWGLVVNEAMASGLPVLVSNRCGCAVDLVTEGVQGWTFDPVEVPSITAALVRLAALPDEQRTVMGQAARERIAAWSPAAFSEGLWRAAEAARAVPARKLGWLDRLLLAGMLCR